MIKMNSSTETDRVRARTSTEQLREIDISIRDSVRRHASLPRQAVTERIGELRQEWDIERWLQANAAMFALTGVVLGATVNRRWLLLTGGVLGFLFQHAVQGWCPPVPLFRRLGVRTRSEIERERYALKAVRGDFDEIRSSEKNPYKLTNEVMRAVAD